MDLLFLVVFVLSAFLLLLLYCGLLHRKLQSQSESYQEQIKSITLDIHAVSNGSVGVGRKVLVLEHNMLTLHNLLEDLVRNDPSRVSYTEANRLVEMGADVEDLMNSCGISRPEAELVSALSQSQSKAESGTRIN